MKKTIAVILTAFLCLSAFAQSTKKLGPAVYDFATKPSDTWTIYDADFKSMDIATDSYVFNGGFVIKNIVGYARYDFTCTVNNSNGNPSVELTNMVTYACYKNGEKVANASTAKPSARVASQYAALMVTEINARNAAMTNEQYEANLSAIVTDPGSLLQMAKANELKFKKFLTDYNVIGRPVTVSILVTSISESHKEGYAYQVTGTTEIISKKSVDVIYYTNDDRVIDIDISKGSIIEAKGTLSALDTMVMTIRYTIVE